MNHLLFRWSSSAGLWAPHYEVHDVEHNLPAQKHSAGNRSNRKPDRPGWLKLISPSTPTLSFERWLLHWLTAANYPHRRTIRANRIEMKREWKANESLAHASAQDRYDD